MTDPTIALTIIMCFKINKYLIIDVIKLCNKKCHGDSQLFFLNLGMFVTPFKRERSNKIMLLCNNYQRKWLVPS